MKNDHLYIGFWFEWVMVGLIIDFLAPQQFTEGASGDTWGRKYRDKKGPLGKGKGAEI